MIAVELVTCLAFVNVIFKRTLKARRHLLFVFISASFITFLYSCFLEHQLASPVNLEKICKDDSRGDAKEW